MMNRSSAKFFAVEVGVIYFRLLPEPAISETSSPRWHKLMADSAGITAKEMRLHQAPRSGLRQLGQKPTPMAAKRSAILTLKRLAVTNLSADPRAELARIA